MILNGDDLKVMLNVANLNIHKELVYHTVIYAYKGSKYIFIISIIRYDKRVWPQVQITLVTAIPLDNYFEEFV